jgi:hypothetical protein
MIQTSLEKEISVTYFDVDRGGMSLEPLLSDGDGALGND